MARTVTKNQIKEAYRPEDKKALPQTSSGGFSCSQKITFNNTEFDSNGIVIQSKFILKYKDPISVKN